MKSNAHQSSSFESILLFESSKYPSNIITYFDDLGNKNKIEDKVQAIRTIDGIKYLILENSNNIKLELVYGVDNEISPFHSDGFFNCDCV
ncbi:MAG: hypothetical protein ACJA2S_000230 [Cyclobacteriaceae bacterium]|jgi:hypothetical protein